MAFIKRFTGNNGDGKVTYNESVVKGIVILAVSEVQGVLLKKSGADDRLDFIKVEFNGDNVVIDISVEVKFGFNIPDVAFDIQETIKHNIEAMSKYKVSSVNVHFEDVKFEELNWYFKLPQFYCGGLFYFKVWYEK